MDNYQKQMHKARVGAEDWNKKNMAELKKKSAAWNDFVVAAEQAKSNAADSEILGYFDENSNLVITQEQANKAACHGREDTAAVLMLQLKIMQRLDRNRNYMWGIIVLLLFVAGQFK